MFLTKLADVLCGDGFGQGTTGPFVGNQDNFVRVEEFGGLGHEVHTGQHDNFSIGFCGSSGQRQRIAADVGNTMKDLWCLIVMGKHDRVAPLLEIVDGRHIGCMERPLDRWNHGFHALIRGGGRSRKVCRIFKTG